MTAAFVGSFVASAQSSVLSGNYLRIGVSSGGCLIDDDFSVGLQYDVQGAGNFSTTGPFGPQDLLLDGDLGSGSKWEYFGLHVNGMQQYLTSARWNPFGLVTTCNQATHTAETSGKIAGLDYTGVLSFDADSSVIDFSVKLQNNTGSDISNIYFARGLDPQPDYWQNEDLRSKNTAPEDLRAWVTAAGYIAWPTVTIRDLTGNARVAVTKLGWGLENAFELYRQPVDDGDGDHRIHIAYYQDSLAANGGSVEWKFQYAFVPEPADGMSVVGLAALGGGLALRRRRSS